MKSQGLKGVIGACALAITALAVPAAASAAQPSCGDTITQDVKLTADLDCSAHNGDGLIIGKKGVTIDLNGHALTGPSTNSYNGINDEDGYDNVTVKDGKVAGYYTGVLFEYTTGSKMLDLEGEDNGYSDFSFWYSQHGMLKGLQASAQSYSIYLYENNDVNLSNSKAIDGGGGATGIYDYYSAAKITHVKSTGNYYGIYVEEPIAGHWSLTGSKANDNSYAGVYVSENYPTALYQATVSDNVADDNGDYGLYADVKSKGSGNSAHGNGTANCFHVKC